MRTGLARGVAGLGYAPAAPAEARVREAGSGGGSDRMVKEPSDSSAWTWSRPRSSRTSARKILKMRNSKLE